jgi:hypothetical protein
MLCDPVDDDIEGLEQEDQNHAQKDGGEKILRQIYGDKKDQQDESFRSDIKATA